MPATRAAPKEVSSRCRGTLSFMPKRASKERRSAGFDRMAFPDPTREETRALSPGAEEAVEVEQLRHHAFPNSPNKLAGSEIGNADVRHAPADSG